MEYMKPQTDPQAGDGKPEAPIKPARPLVRLELPPEAAATLRRFLDRVKVTGTGEAQQLIGLAITLEAAMMRAQGGGQ